MTVTSLDSKAKTFLFATAFLILNGVGRSVLAFNPQSVSLTDTQVSHYLSSPQTATGARYDLKDSAGNSMQSPSILQMKDQAYKYAAVYHTPAAVSGGYRYSVKLAASNDLLTWTYVRTLIDNADMPKLAAVSGSNWILLAHEQWSGAGAVSKAPCQISFKLFYDLSDLMNGSVRSTWTAPSFRGKLNGTPSIYEAHLAKYGSAYAVDGQFGFHVWDGTRDVNAVTTILDLFDPSGGVKISSSIASAYNKSFASLGVSGNLGQRDTLVTPSARYNIQEGNLGKPGGSWDQWRIWLYTFGDTKNYVTGNGVIRQLAPKTPGGSTSFGNPSVSVVDSPDGVGQALVISYFLFTEGAAPGEAGSLLYYFKLP